MHRKQGANRPTRSVDVFPSFSSSREHLAPGWKVQLWCQVVHFRVSCIYSNDSQGRQADAECDAPTDLKQKAIELHSYSTEGSALLPITLRTEPILNFACLT